MKAIVLGKKIYPKKTKKELINQYCPDTLQMCEQINCSEDTDYEDCKVCWDREVDDKRCDWLIESKKMCDLLGCN